MTTAEVIGVLGGVVGSLGGGAGILSVFYQRKQTRLTQEQIVGLRSRDTSYDAWTAKWEQAADALIKICPAIVMIGPSNGKSAYEMVFSEPLRRRIALHLGKQVFFSNKFRPKFLSKDELLNSTEQEVINEVLEAMRKFKQEHTDWSRSLKLLE